MSIEKVNDLVYTHVFATPIFGLNDSMQILFHKTGLDIGSDTIPWEDIFKAYVKLFPTQEELQEKDWTNGLY